MDQTQLQEKIALYYQKLPEETKMLFAGMSWLETLKEIDTKYSLNDEQIKTLGTETTILLLGIISIEDYVQTIKTEIKLEGTKTDEILDEVGEKIIKDVAPLLYDAFEKNAEDLMIEKFGKNFDERIATLPEKIQEAINDSNYQVAIYEIGNKFGLNIDQIGTLEEITIKVLAGITPTDRYESEIKSKINIPEDKSKEMIALINENVFKNIKEILKENWDKKGIKIPLPPYKVIKNEELRIKNENTGSEIKKEEGVIINKEEEKVIKNEELRIKNENTIPKPNYQDIEQKKTEEKVPDHDIYREQGIEIVTDNNIKKEEKPVSKTSPSINIAQDKLFNNTASKITVTDYSLPKINVAEESKKMVAPSTTKPHDPYHEEI